MPGLAITRAEARKHIRAVEAALKAGHFPPGHKSANTNQGALRIAAKALKLTGYKTMERRVGTPHDPGGAIARTFPDLPLVDWSLYKAAPRRNPDDPEEQKRIADLYIEHGRSVRAAYPHSGIGRDEFTRRLRLAQDRGFVDQKITDAELDPVQAARERNKGRDLAAENKDLLDRLIKAEDIRSGLFGLINPPLVPKITMPPPSAHKGQRTVIIHFSDWHVGETVDIDEMGGVNAYSVGVFQKRAGRLCATAKSLLTTHWKGEKPEKIVLIFGGDMITGEIHDELAKTNEALSAPAVRICAETLGGIVIELRKIAPLDIYTVPGNHGRLTKKPESKGMAVNSFDTLISNVVEMTTRTAGLDGVSFYYPKSGDALFNIYKWIFCAVHGDRIGSRGGQGFQGPLATVLRGIHKTRAYYAGQSIIVDHFLVGHFHTTAKIPRAFCNGSLVGPSEYSRDLRADPEPSKQNLIVVHSERGVISFEEIYCGDPSEGQIYRAVS